MQNTHFSRHILIKLQFPRHVFEKFSNAKFHNKKSVQWKPSFSMPTDGRTDKTKQTVALKNFSNAPKRYAIQPSVKLVDGANSAFGLL
jgi:hypothetical protein